MLTYSDFIFDNITHKFFNKQFALSTHHYNLRPQLNISMTEILNNHKLVMTELSVNYLKVVKQIHSNKVYMLENIDEPTINIEADAIVTKLTGVAIGIYTADCVPILLVEPKNRMVAVVHAGWRGALSNIISNTVDVMTNQHFGGELEQIHACIGPCIHQESYEVSSDLYEKFMSENSSNAQYFDKLPIDKRYLFDVKCYVKHKLSKAGIRSICEVPHNSFAMPAHYASHRRSSLYGKIYQESLLSTICMR